MVRSFSFNARSALAFGSIVLVAWLAGCTNTSEQFAPPDATPPDRVLLAEREDNDPSAMEADVNCVFGGVGEQERVPGARVFAEATSVVFTLEIQPSNTGFQFGYAVEPEEEVTWLPVVREGGEQRVPVGENQTEVDDLKWHFFYRLNTEPEQDCYTGAAMGGIAFTIEAVRE